ncbi:endolytic transglycosylase MltG [Nesterenkonia flava]|uniref:Endolytic murein transglycosylase n=1 Tax=Nesterenkonia flava TaxID=469799 RepID=A0ABU1FPR1_9MICC|nr:endolytic transglycosylase MltG [Nesterenkonia flava]MDR5710637.1 endolytic transglycosylase MltG [Nesterenkonia flava]
MSDEQPPEVGSRRRRREIREARERARAAERERLAAARRLGSTATPGGIFDQEASEPKVDRAAENGHRSAQSQNDPAFPSRRALRQQRETGSIPRISPETPQPKPVNTALGEEQPPVASSRVPRAQESRDSATNEEPTWARLAAAQQQSRSVQQQPDRSIQAPGQRTVSAAESSRGQQQGESESLPIASSRHESAPASPAGGTEPGGGTPEDSSAEGSADEGVSAASPVPEAGPATPFEHVLSPQQPSSPAEAEHVPEDEHAYAGEDFHDHEDFDGEYAEEWELTEDGEYIEHDENGVPVLVGASSYGRGYQTVTAVDSEMSRNLLERRRAKRRRRNIAMGIAFGGFVALMVGLVIVVQSLSGIFGDSEPQDYEQVAGDLVSFRIEEGDGLENVAGRLVDQGIVASRDAFFDAVAEFEGDATPHPDEFMLNEQMPAADAVEAIFGDGVPVYTVYIEPNMWIEEAFAEIAAQTPHSVQDLEAAAADPTAYGLPEQALSLEGYLPPGEHSFPIEDEMTAEEILTELTSITLERLEEQGITDPQEQYETVIIASLITAEANHNDPDSYPVMAGAIQNRLEPDNPQTDGYLFIDATNNYGLGEHDIHGATQLDEDSPWNSRTQPGLPPGPVGAPLRATLEAAAHPQENDYNYWVTVNLETGQTEFSETYEQHQVYEREFLQWCDDNPGVCSPADVESAEEGFEG